MTLGKEATIRRSKDRDQKAENQAKEGTSNVCARYIPDPPKTEEPPVVGGDDKKKG